MTNNLRLLLEEFLGLMREEGELDKFLPVLLSAMGHQLVYTPQKGPRQYGVDICSVAVDEDGRKKLFLWTVKRGNVGRKDWNVDQNSIRQSLEDIEDTYIRTHVAPQHKRLPIKVMVATNGEFGQALAQTLATYQQGWTERTGAEVETVNGSMLACWTQEYLLDENVLPAESRALFRRALVNVGVPELSLEAGRSLVDSLLAYAQGPAKSSAAQKKRLLQGLRGLRAALSVMTLWGRNEENLVAPYRLAEYALLAMWSRFHEQLVAQDDDVMQEYMGIVVHHLQAGTYYHAALQPYYHTQNALADALSDSLLVSEAAFRELGLLGQMGLIWAKHAVVGDNPLSLEQTWVYASLVQSLLDSHTCTGLPPYDECSTDIHVVLLFLLVTGQRERACVWLDELVDRFAFVLRFAPRYVPMSASFEDVLLVREGEHKFEQFFVNTSTLIPVLLVWTAALDLQEAYERLRTEVVSVVVERTTLNLWHADTGYDSLLNDPVKLHAHGVAQELRDVPATPDELLQQLAKPGPEVLPIDEACWYKASQAYLPLLAARHWHLQVPCEMLVRHAMAVSEKVLP